MNHEATSRTADLTWLRALRTLGRARGRRERGHADRWDDALAELARVHRNEQAELVRRARRHARAGASRDERSRWRRDAVEEVRVARADGFEPSWRLLCCLLRGSVRSSAPRPVATAGAPTPVSRGSGDGGAAPPAAAAFGAARGGTPDAARKRGPEVTRAARVAGPRASATVPGASGPFSRA